MIWQSVLVVVICYLYIYLDFSYIYYLFLLLPWLWWIKIIKTFSRRIICALFSQPVVRFLMALPLDHTRAVSLDSAGDLVPDS